MRESYPNWWISSQLIVIIQSVKTGVSEFLGEKFYFSTGSIKNHSYTPEGSFNYYSRPSRANRIAFLNDVFQARMKTTNKGLLINDDFKEQLFSTGFLQLRPYGDTFNPKLLYYFIISPTFLNQRDDLATGSTQEALTDTKAVELSIPLPPLNEQKRIVAKLDTIIPRIDSLKARLDNIPALIKRFRQSVLTAAVTGKLTETWRGNRNLSDKWFATTLDEQSEYITSGSRGWAKYYSKSGAIFVRAQNIKTDDLILDDVAFVSLPYKTEGLRTRISKQDILITITGANVTKTAIVKTDISEAYVNQHVALVRLKQQIFSEYIYLWLVSPTAGRAQLEKAAYGAGKPGLNLQNIKDVDISLPPIEEQKEIVRQVEKLFILADKLETHYQNAKARIDKLSQSVLAKAFRGELVPQDPNDEPAEKLLERIMAEKAKMESALKRGKKKGGAQKAKAGIRK